MISWDTRSKCRIQNKHKETDRRKEGRKKNTSDTKKQSLFRRAATDYTVLKEDRKRQRDKL